MLNHMETNKLLTLEEIEKMEASVDSFDAKTKAFFARKGVTLNTLLATARAYWEMFAIYNDTPTVKLVDIEDTNNNKLDDTPHLPTLKVIVEALWDAKHAHDRESYLAYPLNDTLKSLEKHLE